MKGTSCAGVRNSNRHSLLRNLMVPPAGPVQELRHASRIHGGSRNGRGWKLKHLKAFLNEARTFGKGWIRVSIQECTDMCTNLFHCSVVERFCMCHEYRLNY